jgi:ArsR family transcriptional regulator, arsenate/arsenite/antimonite-responsive transcriptional repressor
MSTRVLEIADRKLGERCCEPGLKPALSGRAATELAGDFELLAHPVRLQLLDVLARNEGKVCVCDLESAVPVKQPTVSHHLRLLREAGLIDSEKVGQWVYYHVRRDMLRRLQARMSQVLRTIG